LPVSACDGDGEAAVLQLLIARDASGSADAAQLDRLAWRALVRISARRLDDAEDARAAHHVVDHLEVARLENAERQDRPRQQNGPPQWKQRQA
jgi:hypothetical protein